MTADPSTTIGTVHALGVSAVRVHDGWDVTLRFYGGEPYQSEVIDTFKRHLPPFGMASEGPSRDGALAIQITLAHWIGTRRRR
jgi:hypothetical protein